VRGFELAGLQREVILARMAPRQKSGVRTRELEFLSGGGEMGQRIRAYPWREHLLGEPASWPQGLRTAVRVMLTTQHPAFVFWGPSLICFYNDAYSRSLGPEKHPSALGTPAGEVWQEIWHIIGPQIDQVMRGEGATWHENQLVPIVRHGGLEDVYWTYSFGPIDETTAPNGIGGVLVLCTETTQQVVAERRLTAERERFAQLFEQAPTFMAVLRGPDHLIELANPGYLRLVGHRPVIGKTIAEALPDAVAQGYLQLLDRVFRTGEPFIGTGSKYAMQNSPDGPIVERYVDFVYQPITDAAGDVTGIFVEGADVTERALAEQALRAKEEQLREVNNSLEQRIAERSMQLLSRERLIRTVYEHSSECHAVMLELEGGGFCYEEINPATLRLYKKTREEVIGRTIEEVLGPAAAAELGGHLRASLESGTPHHYERVQGPGIVEAVAVPVPGEPGTQRRLVVSARDVSERRRLEQQLRQSQKMEAVGELTGGLAHDFNNLLAGIGGSLEVLKIRLAQGRTDDVERYIVAGQGAVKRAAALTHRLLTFARRQTLDAKPTDLNRLAADIAELVRRTVGPGIRVEVVGAAGLWSTLVDPNQLESALLNLCINARDAMPDGGQLTIETANRWLDERAAQDRDVPPGQYLSLCVSDTGSGMTPEVIARAFDPFFTTKPLGQGTGLGLSMVYGFARQSGGQARIYSEPGKGSMVCLYLPRYRGPTERVDAVEVLPEARRPEEGTTVLLVDDEPTVRALAVEVLRDHGYITIEADDGVKALRVLQTGKRIDLLITDVGLPAGINGRQLADAGKLLRPGLKVLFITGYAENALISHGHLDPSFHVLTKPFAMEELARRAAAIVSA
jgi:PAS domain S-box-containing protein